MGRPFAFSAAMICRNSGERLRTRIRMSPASTGRAPLSVSITGRSWSIAWIRLASACASTAKW
jgi:hypothetical protein